MKQKLKSLSVGLAAVFFFTAAVSAADNNNGNNTANNNGSTASANTSSTAAGNNISNNPGLLPASQIKGTAVTNLQKQSIGNVDEVLVDPNSGRIRFLVLGVGGTHGNGEMEVAVPWDAFKVTENGGQSKFVLDASKERLEKAPRVEGKNYDRLYARDQGEPAFVYWGVTWYDLGPMASASASSGASASPAPHVAGTPYGSNNTTASAASSNPHK